MQRPADLDPSFVQFAASAVLSVGEGDFDLRLSTLWASNQDEAEAIAMSFWSARAPVVRLVVIEADT